MQLFTLRREERKINKTVLKVTFLLEKIGGYILGINIGKFHIGYRSHDKHLWKKYLIPKAYDSDKYFKHHYFKFYYRWLNLFWCMPRKCECCGKYMTSAGGTNIYDIEGNEILITICKPCKDNKEFVDRDGVKHEGYDAWIHELWKW